MKIGFISTMRGSRWGGSEELWHAAANAALDEGHQVFVSIFQDFPLADKILALKDKGAKVFKNRPNTLNRLRALERVIERRVFGVSEYAPARLRSPFRKFFEEKPDVICISESATYDIYVLPDLISLLNESAIPYMVVVQLASDDLFPYFEEKRAVVRDFYQRAFCAAMVAEDNVRIVERQIREKLENEIILKNPVNLPNTDLLSMPESKTVRFANVARLETFHKGQDILFESLGGDNWRERDWELNLYGEGEHRRHLENLAATYGISDKVNFLGHADDIRKVWEHNHLLTMASRREGTPLSLVEAMVCGRPSVVTDVGGNADWVSEPETGFVAEAPRAKYFEAALERAWQARAQWQAIGENAHRFALENISLSPGKDVLDLLTRKK